MTLWQQELERYENLCAEIEASVQLALKDCDEREEFMDTLRVFKQERNEKLIKDYKEGELPLEKMMFSLTALAETCLQAAYLFESHEIKKIYGLPNSHFHMVAMGKFGGCEMTVQSDLDLIFLFAEPAKTTGPKVITNQEYFARLVQRVISNVSLMTRRGRAYQVDAELRPSGRAGILVSSWKSFEEYHQRDARIWEKQALLRARPIEPEVAVRRHVHDKLHAQLWNRTYGANIAEDILELRQKMEKELAKEGDSHYNIKVGPGGIVDIEFAVQYLQLRHGGQCEAVRAPHTLTGLRALAAEGILAEKSAEELESAYLFYRRVETALRQLQGRAVSLVPCKAGDDLQALADFLKEDPVDLVRKYETLRQEVRQSYIKVLQS